MGIKHPTDDSNDRLAKRIKALKLFCSGSVILCTAVMIRMFVIIVNIIVSDSLRAIRTHWALGLWGFACKLFRGRTLAVDSGPAGYDGYECGMGLAL